MRLAASLRFSLYATTAVVFASGVIWLTAHYFPGLRTLGNGTAAAAMRVHGGAAMVLLVLIGCVVSLHAPEGWRERKNLATGISLGATLALLTATGYCLYYLGGESSRAVSSLSHWVLGLVLPAALVCHTKLGRPYLRDNTAGKTVTTSISDVTATVSKNPENATATSGMRR